MMKRKDYKSYFKNVIIPVFVYGAFTGLLVGTIVYFFKWMAEFLTEKSVEIYHYAQAHLWLIPVIIAGAVALAFVMYFLQRWAPETAGGGIPRAEGVLRGLLTFRWLRTAIAVIINSWISFFAGLPLGSEGPSVLLGTSIGGGTCKLPLSHNSWDRYIMTGGACAGFAVATAAPVTGILFALEEAHKRFTPMIFLMAMSSVLFGVTASNLWTLAIGHAPAPLFALTNEAGDVVRLGAIMGEFNMSDIWVPIILGVVIALVACGYNLFVFIIGKTYDTKLKRIPQWARLVIVFVLTAAIGLIAFGEFQGTDALGGGGGLIVKLAGANFSWKIIFVLLVIRFLMIAFSTGSGATGGVFIPMLSIGALLGALLGELFVVMGMSQDLYSTVVMLSMCAFMGACTRAPLTALVFMVESTWSFSNLFYVAITVFISYFLCEIVNVEPLYDVLLERMIHKQNHGKEHQILRLEFVVQEGAFAIGKAVRDILWPSNTKVSEIVASDLVKRMDDDGEKKIHVGDKLTIITQTFDEAATTKELEEILGAQAGE
ncbi:MAG: chloride channel protein [Clostridiales bacterium]|nr:chloride channel protein [Clostridiales bacterium]